MQGQAASQVEHQTPRERILLTAHELFYQNGIRATGVDRIIADAKVTKVTFYRHFPSKSDLILAFLAYRHELWMTWFANALQRHGGGRGKGLRALVPALGEWLGSPSYRGCAFINSVSELGHVMPEVLAMAKRHKQDMTHAIAALMPASPRRTMDARAICVAVDGAIVHAQFDSAPADSLRALRRLVRALESHQAIE